MAWKERKLRFVTLWFSTPEALCAQRAQRQRGKIIESLRWKFRWRRLLLLFIVLILCVCYPQVKDIMLTVPNAITISRIMASPLISWCILDSQWEAALAGVNIRLPYDIYLLWRTSIFIWYRLDFLLTLPSRILLGVCLAGASDCLDGFIARSYDQRSHFGSLLDPLADKILVAAVAIPMSLQEVVPCWLVALMLGRDIGLVAGALWVRGGPDLIKSLSSGHFKEFNVEPTHLSKVNTALQVCLMGTSLTGMAWQIPPPEILDPLWYVFESRSVIDSLFVSYIELAIYPTNSPNLICLHVYGCIIINILCSTANFFSYPSFTYHPLCCRSYTVAATTVASGVDYFRLQSTGLLGTKQPRNSETGPWCSYRFYCVPCSLHQLAAVKSSQVSTLRIILSRKVWLWSVVSDVS